MPDTYPAAGRFEPRAQTVDAWRVTPALPNHQMPGDLPQWMLNAVTDGLIMPARSFGKWQGLWVETPVGCVRVEVGEWVTRSLHGRLGTFRHNDFRATYLLAA